MYLLTRNMFEVSNLRHTEASGVVLGGEQNLLRNATRIVTILSNGSNTKDYFGSWEGNIGHL